MKSIRSLEGYREPYVRGPHVRYFLISIWIAFVTALLAILGMLSVIRLISPMG